MSVTYRDNDCPGCLIREDSDDRRFIIDLDPNNGYKEVVIREIPAHHKTI